MSLLLSASIPGILGIGQGDRAPFELRVGPLVQGELVVRAFELREAVSACFEADLEVLCDLDPMLLRPLLLAQPATLVLSTPKRPRRIVRGVLSRVVDLGPDPRFELAHAWSLRLVPRLWLLSRRINTRIFQDRTVPEVIGEVLQAARVPFASRLARSYPRAEYILQYAESDLEFVQRLCAQEGIFTYFEPPSAALDELLGGAASALAAGASAAGSLLGDAGADLEDAAQAAGLTESFVLCDEAAQLPPIDDGTLGGRLLEEFTALVPAAAGRLVRAPSLWYREAEGMQGDHDDAVTAFARGREVASTRVVMRDYDFRTPGVLHEAAADLRAASLSAGLSAKLSVGLSAGGVSASAAGALSLSADLDEVAGPRWMEVYDHRQQLAEPDTSRVEALTLLEQHRRDASFGEGASLCRRLGAGCRFTLDEHPSGEFNREYAVASAHHRGVVPALRAGVDPRGAAPVSYSNTFRCVPASVPLRPPPLPRRTQQVTELATVVGPPGEEVYTDALGRVRVHFAWDREGRANHRSACWVRVVQPWAGAAWGHQFIPRVGMEVLVTFLGGDTDLPVIVGSLYNGANAPPFGLPASKTRSGIRTSSSLGGGGHNELSFEDATGAEQVLLHAQRDWDASARRDHTRDVGRDERVSVRRDRVEAITRDHRTEVGGDRVRAVGGALREEVRGGRSTVVEAGDDTRVNGDRALRVGGATRTEQRGDVDETFRDDRTLRVHGCDTTVVGRHGDERSWTVRVEGVGDLSASRTLELCAEEGVVLRCGESELRVGPKGIELRAASVRSEGAGGSVAVDDKGLRLASRGAKALLRDNGMLFKTETTAMGITSEVSIGTSRVLINSPEVATDVIDDDDPPPTSLSLTDEEGHPLAGQRFLLTFGDGSVRSGVTDGEGRATLHIDEDAEVLFPDLGAVRSG